MSRTGERLIAAVKEAREVAKWQPFHDPMRAYRDRPSNHRLIWIWRNGWPEPQLTPYEGMSPMMNVMGLYWQPAVDGEGRPTVPHAIHEPTPS